MELKNKETIPQQHIICYHQKLFVSGRGYILFELLTKGYYRPHKHYRLLTILLITFFNLVLVPYCLRNQIYSH